MKFTSLLNLGLIFVTVVGMVRCYQLQTQLAQFHNEFESLSSSYGDFSQEQNSLPQIIRLKTNDPAVFQWRVYLPPGYSGGVIDKTGYRSRPLKLGHGMPWSYPSEILITQKFEIDTDSSGQAKSIRAGIQCTNWVANKTDPVNYVSGQGSSRQTLGRRARSEFVADHWDDIVFASDEAGSASVVENEVSLLKVTIPEELMEEYLAIKGFRPRENENVLKDLYLQIEKIE